MSYQELTPINDALRPFIECFWITSPGVNQVPKRITPDGCCDLIYPLPALTGTLTAPLLVGTMTHWTLSTTVPATDLLGIRFRPGGIYPFLKIPLHLFTDAQLDMNEVVADLGTQLQNNLLEIDDWPGRFQALERYLYERLQRVNYSAPLIMPVVQHLIKYNGQISIDHVSDQANVSRRQLERLFRQYIGVSPKLLARILRFRHLKAMLRTGQNDSLMGIAFDNGYTDHAHLTKEFKEFTGLTPTAYLTR
ncbi:AraC family transcriptional regulator [Spirosoma arcticum]